MARQLMQRQVPNQLTQKLLSRLQTVVRSVKVILCKQTQVMMFMVAHGNEADTHDGTNSETLAQHIEDKIPSVRHSGQY